MVKMSALGDVIQALPVIPALQDGFPGARIHWLVEEGAAPVVRSHPGVHRVIVSRRGRWGREWRAPRRWPGTLREIGALMGELRTPHFDMALDLQGLIKSGIWIRCARAERKVGYDGAREWSHLSLNERVPRVSPDLHAVERYLMLAEAAGGRAREARFGLEVRGKAREDLWALLEGEGWRRDQPYAVLVPAARWQSKQADPGTFSAVGDWLARTRDLPVALVGVPEERSLAQAISRRMRTPALDLCGRTDLELLMALLEGARVVVSTDSGPMHLAAALGTPVVACFGPTAPWRTGPYGRGHRIVRAGVSCSPCFRRSCRGRQCMTQIRPEAIRDAVAHVLRAGNGDPETGSAGRPGGGIQGGGAGGWRQPDPAPCEAGHESR